MNKIENPVLEAPAPQLQNLVADLFKKVEKKKQ